MREPLSFFIVSGYRNSPRRHKDSKTRRTVRRLEFTILTVVTHKLVDKSRRPDFFGVHLDYMIFIIYN
ncbi:hypothetical protein P8452_29642 [Trifolium repens]|nr:hypothetical protein P8452_29642 [Trifolium repens]